MHLSQSFQINSKCCTVENFDCFRLCTFTLTVSGCAFPPVTVSDLYTDCFRLCTFTLAVSGCAFPSVTSTPTHGTPRGQCPPSSQDSSASWSVCQKGGRGFMMSPPLSGISRLSVWSYFPVYIAPLLFFCLVLVALSVWSFSAFGPIFSWPLFS